MSRTTSKDKAKDWQSKAEAKAKVSLIVWGQGQGLAVQGQDQELETQDQGRGQLASRVLEAKAMSLKTPYLMCIKAYCVQYTAYSTVLYTTSSMIKKIMTGGLGGSQDPPLATPMDLCDV